uniref:Uncharacterized protein n=1 Tax=Plectus sambesii TaxID=2011161 RepID=A0A914W329_9BILA
MLLSKIRRVNKYFSIVGLPSDLEQPIDWTGSEEFSTAAFAARLINSEQEIVKLNDSWRAISKSVDMNQAMQQVFESLLEERDDSVVFFKRIAVPRFMNSSSSKSFEIASTKEHGGYLAKILSNVMDEMRLYDDSREPVPSPTQNEAEKKRKYPHDIGAFHRHLKAYAFKVDLWDSVGVTMLQALRKLGPIQNENLLKSWTILIACMADDMREGFADQRQFQRQSIRRGSSRGPDGQELRRTMSGSPNVNDSRAGATPAAVAFGRWQRKCSSMRVARQRFTPGVNDDADQV